MILDDLRSGDFDRVFACLEYLVTHAEYVTEEMAEDLWRLLHAPDEGVQHFAIGVYSGLRRDSDEPRLLRYLIRVVRAHPTPEMRSTAYLMLSTVSTRFSYDQRFDTVCYIGPSERKPIDWRVIREIEESLAPDGAG